MGSKAAKRRAFLAEHPKCCFCGGGTASEEIDHIPSRVLFDNRQWPEGYAFPACVQCNRKTRYDEQVVAVLSRVYPDPVTEQQRKEIQELFRMMAHNHMDVLQEMMPSARKVRTAIKDYGLTLPKGKASVDLPLLAVDGPLVTQATLSFLQKLFLALYYKHSGSALPLTGGIAIKWYSNLQIERGDIPRELAPVVGSFPVLERSSKILDDQFFYRYGNTEDYSMAAFLVFFRQSFAAIGFIGKEERSLRLHEDVQLVGPFQHEQ
ncbi:MAG: hypothetical protein RPU32_10430 [Candidatus Sedimenticola sp. (ex Thyasira tokunagai)]